MSWDLSLRDIKFLRAVRDINGNPEAYEKTELTDVPANKRSITLATDLGKKEVGYRLGGKGGRGFEEGDEPLIERFDPEPIPEENRFGPRSARLTERGLEELSEFEESGVLGGGDVEDEPETIKQLRARIDALEGGSGGDRVDDEIVARLEAIESQMGSLGEQLESLDRQLQSLKESEWGAVDEQYHEDLEKTMSRLPIIYHLLSTVFALDIDSASQEAPLDDESVLEIRASVSELLQSVGEQSGSVEGQSSEEGKPVADDKPPKPSSFDDGSGSPN